MQNILRKTPEHKQRGRAWLYSFLLVAIVFAFMLMGSGGDADTDLILAFDPILLLVIQGFTSAFLFIGIPWLFIGVILKINLAEFFPRIPWITVGATFVIMICAMVVISAVGEWNMNLDFGDSDFAEWARNSEDQLRVLTEHITNFTSTGHFILALFIIAILPGIGEELLFRGLIQNNLRVAFRNHHVAIWTTGFIFAAIHMQFFGVAPRMLLGVLFGYLYHWSGNLSVSMLAHAINNGMAVITFYLAQNKAIEISPEEMEEAAPWPAILFFGLLGTFLLFYFRQRLPKLHE